ncbi:MAG: hypothetical protein KME17_20185 [Cyanosarcina radialis HA8281-LM2]|nr:hypothetical protein [Cyanosarcina radialis HA8281-LM2]
MFDRVFIGGIFAKQNPENLKLIAVDRRLNIATYLEKFVRDSYLRSGIISEIIVRNSGRSRN